MGATASPVSYTHLDLSEKIVRFFETWDMAVLQMCENELILLPFESFWGTLERDVSLVIPYADIESVKLIDDLLNVVIDIETSTGGVRLTTCLLYTSFYLVLCFAILCNLHPFRWGKAVGLREKLSTGNHGIQTRRSFDGSFYSRVEHAF